MVLPATETDMELRFASDVARTRTSFPFTRDLVLRRALVFTTNPAFIPRWILLLWISLALAFG